MDPCSSNQDAIRCNLCETGIVQNYCDFCHVNLCKPCIGEHISDGYDNHKIVSFQQRRSTLIYPKCKTHSNKTCELQCTQCDLFICTLCSASNKHKSHDFLVLENLCKTKKNDIKSDIKQLENFISSTVLDIAKDLENQIADLNEEYKKLSTIVTKHEEEWHREIDRVVSKIKDEISEFKVKHRDILVKRLNEIKTIKASVIESISAFKELEESNVVSTILKSMKKEYSNLPPKDNVLMPTFDFKPLSVEQIETMFGSLTPLKTKKDENGCKKKSEGLKRELLDLPKVINS